MGQNYSHYSKALITLILETLEYRKEKLTFNFAAKCLTGIFSVWIRKNPVSKHRAAKPKTGLFKSKEYFEPSGRTKRFVRTNP